jgi:hypothetical protein
VAYKASWIPMTYWTKNIETVSSSGDEEEKEENEVKEQ